jgi:bifunctional DNase/RNase
MLGQSLLIKRLSSTIEAVDIASLNEGLYLATVTIDERKKSFKFIKN